MGPDRATQPHALDARTAAATIAALTGFSANSLLTRAALRGGAIDPASFTVLRLLSGAAMLAVLVAIARRDGDGRPRFTRDLGGAVLLALYAVPFSWAYTRLDAGAGALVLFASVQATMIVGGLLSGERPRPRQWLGLALALGGLAALVAPGAAAPAPGASAAMALAGVGWGLYSLHGRGTADPLVATASCFALATPVAVAAALPALPAVAVAARGALLAVISGAIASALAYVAWYAALPRLRPSQAATVQLAVPVLAAVAGVILLGEPATARLVGAGAVILAGIALAVLPGRRRPGGLSAQAGSSSSPAARPTCSSHSARTRSKLSASVGALSGR